MRNRLLLPLLPLSLLLGAFGFGAGACGSSSSGSASSGGDCFDYTSFDTTMPSVSFKTDVLPIFRTSCGISSVCHGCDTTADPGCTKPGFNPYLGTSMTQGPPSATQIMAILTATVNAPAGIQTSTTPDAKMVGNPDMMIVKAGDPSHSFMTYKLDGNFPTNPTSNDVTCASLTCAASQSCGQAMPSAAGMPLPESERDIIRRWIAQGAMNN
jgi:hypothetical protein